MPEISGLYLQRAGGGGGGREEGETERVQGKENQYITRFFSYCFDLQKQEATRFAACLSGQR